MTNPSLDVLWEGDCLDIMRGLPPASIDLILCDLPYGTTQNKRLIMSNERLFRYKIVWVKSKPTNFLNARRQPLRRHEDICVFAKKQPKYYPQMTEGLPYDKGVCKAQYTGSYGSERLRRGIPRGPDLRFPDGTVLHQDGSHSMEPRG